MIIINMDKNSIQTVVYRHLPLNKIKIKWRALKIMLKKISNVKFKQQNTYYLLDKQLMNEFLRKQNILVKHSKIM